MTSPDNFKTGFITLIGRPNVGKSTLMNQMIGMKIAITSNKPQTTRNRIQTVYTDDEAQMIFLDTPGIHESKNKLGEYMVKVAQSTLDEVDIILWLVEPSTFIGAGEQEIIKKLKKSKKPVILVINKIDTVDKEKLSSFIERYQKEMDFAEIICTSALKRENIDTLMDAIKKYLPYGPAFYDEDTVTDQPERDIVAEIIREKALRLLKDEVPHGIAVTTESMKERQREKDGEMIMDIEATIICERDSHKGIIIGKNGTMLRKIGSQARVDIEKLIECKTNLQLWVKVRRDWRDDMAQMKTFGYDARKNK
ncbi:MAG: GTPase Era [Butyrivibrio sp.]|nr:GTPase Era [Butyrivibrio sp.]